MHQGKLKQSNTQPLRFQAQRWIRDNLGLYLRFNKLREFNRMCHNHFQNQPVTGVEIGVARGENALEMLETLNIETLYLIDPYKNEAFRQKKALERLEDYEDSVVWVEKTSDSAASEIPEELDFCYIDGLHTYEQVQKDLQNYWPKIGEHGLIGGHDAQINEVFNAIQEFADNKEVSPKILSNRQQYPDWVFSKGGQT